MSFNAEEYYRSVFDEQLASTIEDLEKESEEKTSSMLLAEDIEENRRATIALEEQEKELQGKRERLRERAEKVSKEKEELRQLKRDTAKELQENQAQKLQAIQHAKEEEEKIEKLEKSIEELTKRYEGLLEERQEEHRRRRQAKLNRESSAKMPGKFEDADRCRECRRAEYLRDENLRLKAELKEIDRSNLELQKDIKEEKTRILHLSEELRQKKTELEDITAETERLKLKLEEELTTEHEDEVLNAQIKAGIRSMYQMIAPYWKESEAVEDPFKQLQLIRKQFQLMKAFGEEQKAGETKDNKQRRSKL
ncbi:trichohyalin-like isoform X1 [Puntigrus tetrazona]|uniref:trichohyalin-like isoform X1 n=1 Tax=Puntigrus tetrazona TaxID=1606681 RepID=UPI001C89A11B|nr:trichohyalin-like isoform X1 [Puntigrus tetrazona]